MKWRRGGAVDAQWADEGVVGAGERAATIDVGGWTSTVAGAANRAAVARWAAWAVIVAGPVLAGLAVLSAASAVGTAGPAVVQPVAATAPAGTGPAGFAELFVSAFLSAGQGDQSELAVFWPGARDAQFDGAPGDRQVTQVAAVRTTFVGGDVWSVVVGARVIEPDAPATPPSDTGSGQAQDGGLRYFQVSVASVGGDTAGPWAFSALSAPAEVAAPAPATGPRLVYGPAQPAASSDARVQTVQQFLTAYLAGAGGGLDRFLSPGVQMAPVAPAPYTAVEVETIAGAGDGGSGASASGGVAGDGARQQLLATVLATGRDGNRVPLAYALTLTPRAGRWEITSLDPGPLPAQPTATSAPAAEPSSATAPTTTPAP